MSSRLFYLKRPLLPFNVRVFPPGVLNLGCLSACLCGLVLASGCASGSAAPLEMTMLEPSPSQLKIAQYYNHQATLLRQKAEQLKSRTALYEGLFGSDSDWVTGTRMLAEFYDEAAREQERLAGAHVGLIGGRPLTQPAGLDTP